MSTARRTEKSGYGYGYGYGYGALCAGAVSLVMQQLGAYEDPFSDWLDVLDRVHTAVIETSVTHPTPDGHSYEAVTRYVVKGEKFSVTNSFIGTDGKLRFGRIFVFNGKNYECLESDTGVLQMVSVRARVDKHFLPWSRGIEVPLALDIFDFLGFEDRIPISKMVFSLDTLQDRPWVDKRMSELVRKVRVEPDGSTSVFIPIKGQDDPANPLNADGPPSTFETKYVIRAFPEFGGKRLVYAHGAVAAEKSWHNYEIYKYRSVVLADGSGTVPFIESHGIMKDGAYIPTVTTKKIEINGAVDDDEFDIDPTQSKTILDPFTGGIIKPE